MYYFGICTVVFFVSLYYHIIIEKPFLRITNIYIKPFMMGLFKSKKVDKKNTADSASKSFFKKATRVS